MPKKAVRPMPYAVSEHTKAMLCQALKKKMVQKPLDKITIRELADDCGLKRQAFYYHFQDIYDLVRWMLQQEAVSLLRQHDGALLWQEGLLQLLRYIEENRAVCRCALQSLGRSYISMFFRDDIHAIIHRTVDELHRQAHFLQAPGQGELLTQFYVIALAGVVESWVLGELKCSAEELVDFIDQLLTDQLRGAIDRQKEESLRLNRPQGGLAT